MLSRPTCQRKTIKAMKQRTCDRKANAMTAAYERRKWVAEADEKEHRRKEVRVVSRSEVCQKGERK